MGKDDPLARRGGETLNAWAALNDYARMGPGRSLAKLHADYQRQIDGGSTVPARVLRTLEEWSREHDWRARVEAFDAAEFERQQDKYEEWNDAELERIQKAVETGHSVLGSLFDSVDMRKVPPRDAAAFLRALAEVSKQARGDAERVEVSGPGGGPIATRDETDFEARAVRIARILAGEQDEDPVDQD